MKITDILRAEHTVFHHLFDHIETNAPRLKTLGEIKSLAVLVDKVMAPIRKPRMNSSSNRSNIASSRSDSARRFITSTS